MPLALAAIVVLAIGAGVASAASFGGVSPAQIGVGTAEITPCSSAAIRVDQPRTAFTTVGGARYEVRSVRFQTVPNACVGLKYKLTALDNTSSHDQLATIEGVVPAAGGTVTFPVGAGPNLNSINVADNKLRFAVVVYSG